MLVRIAGTMTMASAWPGGIATASRPIDTVGRPSPITPLTKPASANTAAMRTRRGSNMMRTLTDRGFRHNLELPETAFGVDEGYFCRHSRSEAALSFRDGPKDQTSDAQLRIGESRDSGFDASHRPAMTMLFEKSRAAPGQRPRAL